MAIRNYVGARYVPKFADPVEWQANTSYEAMVIVTYNNASYTSKVPVPPTVGNPAENSTYWALTGNYNAQVEQYRQESEKTTEDLAKETQDRTNADNAISQTVAQNKQDLETDITALKTHKRSFILIGDSFSIGVNGDNNSEKLPNGGWIKRFADSVNGYCNVYWYDRPKYAGIMGGGFSVNPSFLTTLQLIEQNNPNMDKLSITDIIIMGGTNEPANDVIQIRQGIENFMTYAKANYPNAKIGAGVIGSQGYRYVHDKITDGYATIQNYGGYYIKDSLYVYCRTSSGNIAYIGTDGLHLTEAGYVATQTIVNNIILTGSTYFRHRVVERSPNFIKTPDVSVLVNMEQLIGPDMTTTSIRDGQSDLCLVYAPKDGKNIIDFNSDWTPILTFTTNSDDKAVDRGPRVTVGPGKIYTYNKVDNNYVGYYLSDMQWFVDQSNTLYVRSHLTSNVNLPSTYTQYLVFGKVTEDTNTFEF